MTPHDWLWVASLAFGAWNAYQNMSIQNAILSLKVELSDRIAKTEGDVKALQAAARSTRDRD